ncbi:MAG: C1 family peptidase [Acidobacteriota bacterium]|nr:C1 family peptidase [Acidobacteriota bacterium]
MPTKKAVRPKPAKKITYGWNPDLPDHRDVLYGVVHRVGAPLPSSVDLRSICPAVENQGNLSSCTGNALAGVLEILEVKDKAPFQNLSRLFIYYNERVIEHSVKSDGGAAIRDGIKTLVKQGVCTEKKWPYTQNKWNVKPPKSCYTEASKHQVTSYQRIQTLDEMRACLADGFPFVFGFSVYESFESRAVAKSGILDLPKHGERQVGGHAVVAVGYNDSEKRILVRNSWGADWGQGGYFTMPYEYLENRNLSDDLWTIRRAEAI